MSEEIIDVLILIKRTEIIMQGLGNTFLKIEENNAMNLSGGGLKMNSQL